MKTNKVSQVFRGGGVSGGLANVPSVALFYFGGFPYGICLIGMAESMNIFIIVSYVFNLKNIGIILSLTDVLDR